MKTGRLPTACRWRMAAKSIVSQDRYLVWSPRIDPLYYCKPFNWPNKIWWFWIRETNIGQSIFEEAQKPAWVWSSMQSTSVANNVDVSISCGTTTTRYQFLPMLTRLDFFIVATDRQKEILGEKFAKYTNHQPMSIPNSSWGVLQACQAKRIIALHFSMITASRLATEKHIDWLVRAVVRAEDRRTVFWHLWKGGEEGKLRSLIDEFKGGRLYPSQRACQSRGNLEELWGFTCQYRPVRRL